MSASIWDRSTLIEMSSPMRFEKLSPHVYGHNIVIDGKEFSFSISNRLELIRFII